MAGPRCRASTQWALALAVVLVTTAQAYPALWAEEANSCTEHPDKKEGKHGAPVPDSTAKFTITSEGAPATLACPGGTYTVKIAFSEPRLALVTASVGAFTGADASCPNRYVVPEEAEADSYSLEWTLPCSAAGASAALSVTSAQGSRANFQDSGVTLPLSAACAAATCTGGAAPVAAAKPATAAAAVAPKAPTAAVAAAGTAAPAAATAAVAPAASKGAAAAVPGCTPSPLGYSCMATTRQGSKVHYSLGGAAPPDNACTRGTKGDATISKAGADMVHFAYEGGQPGYAALGFTKNPGKMFPSDVVLGYIDADGTPKVSSYGLKDYEPAADDATTGWATHMGVASAGDKTTVCFSRPLDAAAATAVPKLNEAGTAMIWATSPRRVLAVHSAAGGFTADLRPLLAAASGASLAGAGAPLVLQEDGGHDGDSDRIRIAHGALMLAAFALLMPLGALLARHKWLFGDAASGKVAPGWYKLHIYIQSLAVLTAVAGTILIFAYFGRDRQGISKLYTPHMGLGIAATAAGVVQAVIGQQRPGITDPKRGGWRVLHYGWGALTVLGGIANCGLGIALIHGLQDDNVAYWAAPTVAVLALFALGGAVLESKRQQLIRTGGYEPSTHAFSGKVKDPKLVYGAGMGGAGGYSNGAQHA